MAKKKGDSAFIGLLLIFFGGLFLLRNFGLHINVWHLMGKYWPVIIILIGVKLLIPKQSKNKKDE
jgi:small neutral amino acid transporter SnatA (MarC family)